MNIYETMRLWAYLSPRLVRDMSGHRLHKEDSHIHQEDCNESGEIGKTNSMPRLSHSTGDSASDSSC